MPDKSNRRIGKLGSRHWVGDLGSAFVCARVSVAWWCIRFETTPPGQPVTLSDGQDQSNGGPSFDSMVRDHLELRRIPLADPFWYRSFSAKKSHFSYCQVSWPLLTSPRNPDRMGENMMFWAISRNHFTYTMHSSERSLDNDCGESFRGTTMRKIRLNSFLQPPQLRGLSRFLCLAAIGLSMLSVSAPKASAAITQTNITFFTASPPNASDLAISNRLSRFGTVYNVPEATIGALADTPTGATVYAATNDLFVVSSSLGSGNIGSRLRGPFGTAANPTNTPPVINWENNILANNREIAANGNTTLSGVTNINIINPFTPLAAGLPAGPAPLVQSNTPSIVMAGTASSDSAIIVAQGVGSSLHVYFAYEKNAILNDGTTRAASRRVHFPSDNDTAVNFLPTFGTNITFTTNGSVITTNVTVFTRANGLLLFDAAVRWAFGTPDFTSPINLPQQPTDAAGTELLTATLGGSMIVTGAPPWFFQWQRTNSTDGGWTNISGATHLQLTTSPLTLGDNGAFFRAIVSNNFSSVISAPIRLTVSADVTKPTLAAAAGFSGSTNNISVTFSEPVTEASASVASNYLIIDSTNGDVSQVASAGLFGNTRTVVLRTMAPLVPGRGYSVIVS